MIISGILYLIYGAIFVLLTPFRLLPDATLPAGITSAITTINGYFALMNSILPFTTTALMAGISLVVAVEVSVLTYKLIMWVIHKIPGIT